MNKSSPLSVGMLLSLLLFSVFAASAIQPAAGTRASMVWGVTCLMEEDEIQASSYVCEAIEGYFEDTNDYATVLNFYGSQTQRDRVYAYTYLNEQYHDFVTVFYKGHSLWEGFPTQNYLYDDDGNGANDKIWDYGIFARTGQGEHDFVFLWTCGMAYWQGQVDPPVGMSASWLHRDDLVEDSHDNPDDTEHCFISFYLMSPWFTDYTGYGEYTCGDFVTKFYEYATDGYSIDDSLDEASNDCFGDDFEDTILYTGWWIWDPMMGIVWSCIREFGDGSMILTS